MPAGTFLADVGKLILPLESVVPVELICLAGSAGVIQSYGKIFACRIRDAVHFRLVKLTPLTPGFPLARVVVATILKY